QHRPGPHVGGAHGRVAAHAGGQGAAAPAARRRGGGRADRRGPAAVRGAGGPGDARHGVDERLRELVHRRQRPGLGHLARVRDRVPVAAGPVPRRGLPRHAAGDGGPHHRDGLTWWTDHWRDSGSSSPARRGASAPTPPDWRPRPAPGCPWWGSSRTAGASSPPTWTPTSPSATSPTRRRSTPRSPRRWTRSVGWTRWWPTRAWRPWAPSRSARSPTMPAPSTST